DDLHDGGRSEEISTETSTVIIRGVPAVVGTARAVPSPVAPAAHARVVNQDQDYRASIATYSENPFEDVTLERDYNPERDSSVYAGVVDLETVDGHSSSTLAFPAPPRPGRGSPDV
ncbi:5650_t:CDS:1, partial [Acaulospora colombiana]